MRFKLISFTLFWVWAAVVLSAYYLFHKPFDLLNLQALLTSIRSLFTALAVVTACAGVGEVLLRRTLLVGEEDLPGRALTFGLGFGGLGLLWLGLASVGLLNAWIAWLVLMILVAVTYRQWLPWWKSWLNHARSWAPGNKSHRLIAVLVVALAVMSLFKALAPPSAWDALMYHLTSPLHNIQAGKLVVEPSLPESGYPQLVEMHYTWMLLLGSPPAAAVMHWFLGIVSSVLVVGLSRRWINEQAGWLALAVLYSAGTWTTLMGVAYIDLALVFFTMLAFIQLLGWVDEPSPDRTMLLGVIAGFCFGVKYTGAFVGLAAAVLMLWRRPRLAGRIVVYFGISALIFTLPWLLKNLQAGSLIYPFLGAGVGWDSIRQTWFSRVGTGLLATNPLQILTAPVLMTIFGADGAQTWDASFGPLILMLAPLVLIGWRTYRDRLWFRYGLMWVGLLYLGWLVGAASSSLLVIPRLLFPVIPILAILLGGSAAQLFETDIRGLSPGRILLALVLVILVLTTFSRMGEFVSSHALEVALGWESEEDYLYQQLGWYHGAIRSLEALPDTSRVLFLFEPRTYYCPADRCIPDGILDRWYWLRQRELSNLQILDEWRGQDITHVLIYQLGAEMLQSGEELLSEADWEALEVLVQDQLIEKENFGDAYILYELPADGSGAP